MVRPRKYTLNEEFFDSIETEEQAYWLGFIAADGNITNSGGDYSLTVDLAIYDIAQLHLLRKCLGSDAQISGPRKGCMRARFHSKTLIRSLENLGIYPDKSKTIEPWKGPHNLMMHYWRGLFDGDGCITNKCQRGKWHMDVTGSKACVKGFADWASPICMSIAVMHPVAGVWRWGITGKKMPQKLALALYGSSHIALERKQVLANRLIEIDFPETRLGGTRFKSPLLIAKLRR